MTSYISTAAFAAAQTQGAATLGLVNGALVGWDGVDIYPVNAPQKKLTVATSGNSIASFGNTTYKSVVKNTRADVFIVDELLQGVFEFPETPNNGTTFLSSNGNYSHGGATTATMLAELEAQFFTPMEAAGIVPDIVWMVAWLENDVAAVSLTTTQQNTLSAINMIQSRWNNCIIVLAGCRPNQSVNTPTLAANYTALKNWIASIDDGKKLRTYQPSNYEDPANPGNSLKYTVTGSITGSTATGGILTISQNSSGFVPSIGDAITDAGHIIKQVNGDGTYVIQNVSSSISIDVSAGSPITLYPYMDSVVHPNPRGAMLNARSALGTFKSILGKKLPSKYPGTKCLNPGLIGSIAVGASFSSNAHLTGTLPNISGSQEIFGGVVSSSYDTVVTALKPGMQISVTPNALLATVTQSWYIILQSTSFALTNPTDYYEPFIVVQFISGTSSLHYLTVEDKHTDNGVTTGSQNWINQANGAGDSERGWIDGDIVRISGLPVRSSNGSMITAVQIQLDCYMKAQAPIGVPVVFNILEYGVNTEYNNKGTATLVAGTATVSSTKVLSHSKIKVGQKIPGGTPGAVFVSAKTAGTSFIITSTSALDTSVVSWEIDNT